jgi:hypothetical protein
MELDAFTRRLGDGQGHVVGADGSVSFVLGEVEPGWTAELSLGDHAQVTQDLDVTGVALVRAIVTLRVPASLPADLAWEVSVFVDGVKRVAIRCTAGRTKRAADLAANVSKLSGVHSVGVRLELAGS